MELHAVNIYKGSHLLTKREGNGEILLAEDTVSILTLLILVELVF